MQKEDFLWKTGILGSGNPHSMIDTLIFLMGLNFALRSGDEHRNLSRNQLSVSDSRSGKFLLYTEKISKANRRGLKEYNLPRKILKCYVNDEQPDRCLVRMYERYLSLCPDIAPDGPFYLQPLKKPTLTRWFSVVPLGRNTLYRTVSRVCAQAGFKGIFFIFF